ncbi:hypothetical protein [Sphingomonas oryzagri]
MAYDNDRAAFVKNEYRYVTGYDANVKARNPAARSVSIDTQLDRASAVKIAQAYLDDNGQPRAFEIEVKGIIPLSELAGSIPTYILESLPDHVDDRKFKLFKLTVNYDTEISTIQVRR